MKNDDKQVAGLVVLYNPNDEIYYNILSYLPKIDLLYAIDNSDNGFIFNKKLIGKFSKKIQYIKNNQNYGIAYALNQGAELAIKKDYKWLMTMDQDSLVTHDMIDLIVKYIKNHDTERIGIVSPFHLVKYGKTPSQNEVDYVLETMTSGNFLNLHIYKKVGPFLNELFIDSVDHEYCLRLNKNNYKVLVLNKARLEHPLGDRKRGRYIKIKNLLDFNAPLITWRNYNNHNHIRKYYVVRNRLHVSSQYKKEFPVYRKRMIRSIFDEIINIFLFEANKLLKIKSVFMGYIDYKRGVLGKKNFK
jgi:rhamnosyltransferase